MKNKITEIYQKILAHLSWPQSIFLLAVRIIWGWGFFETGKGKWMHLERTVSYFTDLGIPAPHLNAMLAATTEMVGGLLLILGLFSRITSVPLIFTMCVAYAAAEREALMSLFTEDYGKFFEAQPWLYLFACFIILLFGPGKMALDTLLEKNQTKPA